MPSRTVQIDGIGSVAVYKRRNAKSIRITVNHQGQVKVSLPLWLPYSAGIAYARSKADWIQKHIRPTPVLKTGAKIGKYHTLEFRQGQRLSGSTRSSVIYITHPADLNYDHPDVQSAARRACHRALRHEASNLLPQRLSQLAQKHGFTYADVRVRVLTSRWGSCSHQGTITLNIFLMQLPWQLIDYVLLHELTHTKYLNHSQDFWSHMEGIYPGAKQHRRTLNSYNPYI